MLRCDEVPCVDLPTFSMSITPFKVKKPPTSREFVDSIRAHLPSETVGTAGTLSMAGDRTDVAEVNDASTQTEESLEQITEELAELKLKVATLTTELEKQEQQLRSQTLWLSHKMENESKVAFYAGFPSYKVLDACYTFLGPAVHESKNLIDWRFPSF